MVKMCVFSIPVGYRLNKFCGEHLIVVNESPEPELEYPPTPHHRSLPEENDIDRGGLRDENGIERNGPVAEALIQNEQMFHHLKILKPSPSEMENERRKSASQAEKIDKPATTRARARKVYSQVRIEI